MQVNLNLKLGMRAPQGVASLPSPIFAQQAFQFVNKRKLERVGWWNLENKQNWNMTSGIKSRKLRIQFWVHAMWTVSVHYNVAIGYGVQIQVGNWVRVLQC